MTMMMFLFGLIDPIIMSIVLFALYRKAGLRGATMVLCFLPLLAFAFTTFAGIALYGDMFLTVEGYSVLTMMVSAVLYFTPLVVLLMKDWPGRDRDDVFK